MTAQIVFVESANLYVAIADDQVIQFQKNTDPHVNPHAVRVERLDAGMERTFVTGQTLYLDAWALTEFAAWLRTRMPNASTKAFGNAFFDYFPGSMIIADVVAGAGRIVCEPDLKRPPQGDELYYLSRARAANPEGFAMLAAAYAARHLTDEHFWLAVEQRDTLGSE